MWTAKTHCYLHLCQHTSPRYPADHLCSDSQILMSRPLEGHICYIKSIKPAYYFLALTHIHQPSFTFPPFPLGVPHHTVANTTITFCNNDIYYCDVLAEKGSGYITKGHMRPRPPQQVVWENIVLLGSTLHLYLCPLVKTFRK